MSSSSRSLVSAKEQRDKRLDSMLKNLVMEIKEDDETLQETLKVNKVLQNSHTQSDLVIEELLRKLRRTDLSIQILQATMIASTVTALMRHRFKKVQKHARALIRKWREVTDEWTKVQDRNSCKLPQEQEQRLIINPVEKRSEELKSTNPNNSLSIQMNGENPAVPECTPTSLLKLFEGVDEKSKTGSCLALPHDDAFATMEDLRIEEDSSERLKTTQKEKEVDQATDVGKRKASECDRKGKSVAVAQNQLKQKTIERPTSVSTQKKAAKLEIGDLGKRAKSDKNSQLKRNMNRKPQEGSVLKANEGRKVDQKTPLSSYYTRQVVLALPAKRYVVARKRKSNQNKGAKLSQSGVTPRQELKPTMEADELKAERAGKRVIAGNEQSEKGEKRRKVKVIDPEEVMDVKGKQGKKNLGV